MPKVFHYRLKPTKSQVAILNRQLDLCRWVYNETLALRKNAWENEDRSISYFEYPSTGITVPGWDTT